jgi:hypothetical protein
VSDAIAKIIEARVNTPVTLKINKHQLGLIISALQGQIAETEAELETLEEGTPDHDETWQACDDMRETLAELEEVFRS